MRRPMASILKKWYSSKQTNSAGSEVSWTDGPDTFTISVSCQRLSCEALFWSINEKPCDPQPNDFSDKWPFLRVG